MARLYLNENVEYSLGRLLSEAGHDVLGTREAGNAGAQDLTQLEFASDCDRILVTHNRRDFRLLHRRFQEQGKPHCGIILLGVAEPEVLLERMQRLLNRLGVDAGGFCKLAD